MLTFASPPLVVLAGLLGGLVQDKAPPSLPSGLPSGAPGQENLTAWADFIRPSRDELKFESIGWRNRFWPAALEAKKLGRPILLWTMNGHPLGCT